MGPAQRHPPPRYTEGARARASWAGEQGCRHRYPLLSKGEPAKHLSVVQGRPLEAARGMSPRAVDLPGVDKRVETWGRGVLGLLGAYTDSTCFFRLWLSLSTASPGHLRLSSQVVPQLPGLLDGHDCCGGKGPAPPTALSSSHHP
jgi:hypothetical protein